MFTTCANISKAVCVADTLLSERQIFGKKPTENRTIYKENKI
jgi:hypothetical protein